MRLRIATAMLLAVAISSCGKPSASEVNAELSRLVNPALKSALADSSYVPEALSGAVACSDPFVGPGEGVKPGIEFRIPFRALGKDPDFFAEEAARVWKDMGLNVEADDTETVIIRFATKPGYSLNATVNHANQEALISGTGPCVDDPEAD